MNFVLGASGRLGQALHSALPAAQVQVLARAEYADWWQDGGADLVAAYFGERAKPGDVVYIAAGVIDPRQAATLHDRVNFHLPRNIIEGAGRLGMRVMTFGTVMERIVPPDTDNPYYASKIRLGNFIEQHETLGCNVAHVRIHTLYGGGPPDPFMFLGQMAAAIRKRETFRMTSGTQLREYHHIADDVQAIQAIATSPLSGAIELSHGRPVSLRDLATGIFTAFGCLDLLEVGALAAPVADNFQVCFERPPLLRELNFRETLPSVATYLRAALAAHEPVHLTDLPLQPMAPTT